MADEYEITDNDDDGTEAVGSGWAAEEDTIYIGNVDAQMYNGGFRFKSIALAQGESIASAILGLYVAANPGGNHDVHGDDVDDAAQWASDDLPSGITQTTASATWSPTGTGLQNVTVTSIVQEIVDRGAWSTGQDMRFAVIGTGATGLVQVFDVNDEEEDKPATLTITTGSPGGGVPVMMASYRQRRNG